MQSIELGYSSSNAYESSKPESMICFNCGAPHAKLLRCAKCQVATYCQRECQVQDWKVGKHKMACSSYKRVGPQMILASEEVKHESCSDLFGRIRFYACPYAVHKSQTLGRGFLFIQSDLTLAALSLAIPKDTYGRRTSNRAVLVHFLTQGEYDAEVCRDDFEMAAVRSSLQEVVSSYDEENEVVLLFRFRCGHVSIGKSPLVPDYRICKKLGQDYFAENDTASLQLNIDDT